MHGHTNEERREKIIEYIKTHPRTTKRKVVEYMYSNKKMSSLLTTRKILEELISSGRIILATDTLRGRNHYLSYNDEDIFNQINEPISRIEGTIKFYIKHKLVNSDGWQLTRWQVALLLIKLKKLPSEHDFKLLYPKVADLSTIMLIEEFMVRQEADKRRREELRSANEARIEHKRLISESEN